MQNGKEGNNEEHTVIQSVKSHLIVYPCPPMFRVGVGNHNLHL